MNTATIAPPSDDRLRTAARHLVEQLKRLERRHRAGIEPDFSDLQDLFDTTRVVERNLDDSTPQQPERVPCALQPCAYPGVTSIVAGGGLICDAHAEQLKPALNSGAGGTR